MGHCASQWVMTIAQVMINVTQQIEKRGSANCLDRKKSDKEPLEAPGFLTRGVRGHFQPVITNRILSPKTTSRMIHVKPVIWLTTTK